MDLITGKRKQSHKFKLLSACFYEPNKELFIEERLCEKLAELLANCCPPAIYHAEQMLVGLKKSSEEEMRVEHAALFIGPFELLAPPYGSFYLEKGNRVMGDSTLAVKKMYQDAGLEIDVKEPPDHISLELEFMYYLCFSEAEAIIDDNQEKMQNLTSMRKKFLSVYLSSWIPQFCQKIRTSTDNSFYRNLADCLEIVINHETLPLSVADANGAAKHAYQPSI